jgi:hypothetical protein
MVSLAILPREGVWVHLNHQIADRRPRSDLVEWTRTRMRARFDQRARDVSGLGRGGLTGRAQLHGTGEGADPSDQI